MVNYISVCIKKPSVLLDVFGLDCLDLSGKTTWLMVGSIGVFTTLHILINYFLLHQFFISFHIPNYWEFTLNVVIAPVTEALVFRGLLLSLFNKIMPFSIASLLVSIIYGLAHYNQGWTVILLALLFSLFGCYLRYVSKGIYAGIIVHIFYDLIASFVI